MRALEEKICREGQILPGNILKVGNFLNQQIDTAFLCEIGREIARLYRGAGVTRILTMESSGIAIATAAAIEMGVPFVFAKKHPAINQSGELLKAKVHSYTHGNDYFATVGVEYLPAGERVLIVDDFLANGEALNGMVSLLEQAGCEIAGVAIAIEKQFQGGGDKLRARGIRIESLARIVSMSVEEGVRFAD